VEAADFSILGAAGHALLVVFDPARFIFLVVGVLFGLFLGVIPGLGGILGLSLLLPFTFTMDPFAAIAIMLGLLAATSCSDSIPSVLIGVPGTVGAAATILDGHPLAKQGKAGEALGASFFASMSGGVIGAICLAVSIPIMRPLVLAVGTPELLAICVLGLSLVAVLSSGMLLKGLAAAALGILISTIGMDANTGVMRWTFGNLYLWDGIEVVLVALGLFALPELADLFASGAKQIAQEGTKATRFAQIEGARQVIRNKWLLLRSSLIGVSLSSVPGIGAAVIDWIAYAHAKRTVKNADFGNGDVRGIIAAESANSAKDGGHMVPTIAFGVPGGPPMALILGAFLVHNITPGPEMLSTRLDITYSLVWTIALANVIGTALCFLFANQFAKLAMVRVGIIIPLILSIIFIGAYQSNQEWGDFYTLAVFGVIGWVMKRSGWPRPPLILGFVLGALIENYMFISFERYGTGWIFRPFVLIVLTVSVAGILYAGWSAIKTALADRGERAAVSFSMPKAKNLFTILALLVFVAALIGSTSWPVRSQLIPQIICWTGAICCALQLFMELRGGAIQAAGHGGMAHGGETNAPGFYRRTRTYAIWCAGLLAGIAMIGLLPAVFAFQIAFMRLVGKERWSLILPVSIGYAIFMYVLFQDVVHVHWPLSVVGDLVPWLRSATRIL